MKHLMRYEGYTSNQRLDELLDKISKFGIESLTDNEKNFLDSHKSGQQEVYHDELMRKEMETVFEDDFGYFKFEHLETEEYDDQKHFIGILYVPDLVFTDDKRLEGRLTGKIILHSNGQVSPDFYSTVKDEEGFEYDVFEFCNGLEYELDSFLDYVAGELSGKTEN